MTSIINASVSSNGIVSTADASGILQIQSNGVNTNAQAWVNFGYVSGSITNRASYNVSSVVRNSTGNYTINFTNALVDANYSLVATSGLSSGSNLVGLNTATAPTSSAVVISSTNSASGAFTDSTYMNISIFR